MLSERKNIVVAILAIGLVGLMAGVWNRNLAGQPGDAPREIKVPAGSSVEVAVPVAPPEKPREAVKKNDQDSAALALQARLNKPHGKPIAFDSNTPLKEALGLFSDVYLVPIVVDEAAFRADDKDIDVPTLPVRLQKLDNPSLRTALRLLLAQVPDGAYYIRSDFIEITTSKRIRSEILHTPEQPGRFCPPPIHASFNRRPLQEALTELADLAEVNIVVDVRAGDTAKTEVTARFNNVAVETAVQLLADMADLHPVTIENVIYVTTGPNAERLQAQQEKRKQTKPEEKKSERKEEPVKPDA
jgi:hypothetical protein